MALFNLCSDDYLVKTLSTIFKANIVRIPETRIQPLSVLAATSEKPHFWGDLNELLEDPIPIKDSSVEESLLADISGRRSRNINLDLGLQIMEGFLQGFHLPSTAITAKFKGAKMVSFSFQEVVRYFISPGKLGKLLKGYALDQSNGSNAVFFNKEAQMLVLDSVITSKDFSISVEKSDSKNFSLDVPAIERIIGQARADVQIASYTGLDLSFKGATPLTFAFTCIELALDDAGRISLKPKSGSAHFDPNPTFEPKLLFDKPGMIEWEN